MKKITVVLIDDDVQLCKRILHDFNENFHDIEVVGIANNGKTGLGLITDKKPDIAIIDNEMPFMDGVSLVKEIKKNDNTKQIKCVMTSIIGIEYVAAGFSNDEVEYFYLKPYNISALGNTIISLYNQATKIDSYDDIYNDIREDIYTTEFSFNQNKFNQDKFNDCRNNNAGQYVDDISLLLRNMGIYHMNNGFYYLKYAVQLCIDEKHYLNSLTKELYPTVAKMFKTTSARVERSIRHLLGLAWEHGAGSYYAAATGLPHEYKDKRPTSGNFIRQIVEIYEKYVDQSMLKAIV